MTPRQHDVVVVGAGPVGLALSLGLARAGCDVLVLERDPDTAEHSRAPVIWPRTQEILDGLGVIDDFVAASMPLRRVEIEDADHDRVLIEADLSELRSRTDHPRVLVCPQSETESLLHAAVAEQPSARVVFSAEVTELQQRDDEVVVRYRRHGEDFLSRATYAVGCDGASSTVRRCLGASFPGRTYRLRAALADVRVDEPSGLPSLRMTREAGVATAVRIDESTWRMIMPSVSEDESLDDRIELAFEALFGERDHRVTWRSEFRLHRRVSDVWADRRVVLAGDAAHLNSPVGGRGMNVGIQDAEALTRVLIGALGDDDPAPFAGYVAERHEALRGRAFRLLDLLTRLLAIGRGTLVLPAVQMAGVLLRIGPIRRRVLWRMAMLDDPSRRAGDTTVRPSRPR